MADFTPVRVPFDITGLDVLHPPDRMPPGKFPGLRNCRPVLQGGITSRPGYSAPLNAAPFDQLNVHSARRVNNIAGSTPASRRFIGAGSKLYSVDAGVIDTGYSGNPLSMVVWRPDQSTQPWLYVGDSLKMRKCLADAGQTNYRVGIEPPTKTPQVQVGVPLYTVVSDFPDATGWSAGGTAGAPAAIFRDPHTGGSHVTTVAILNFNVDPFIAFQGWANVVPINDLADYGWIGVGARLTIGGELVTVQEVHTQPSNSTILGINVDDGTPQGLCTIQAQTPLAALQRNSVVNLTRQGTVNTAGTAVTWVSGQKFNTTAFFAPTITINGVNYTISSITDATHLVLTTSAGTQTGVAYSADSESPTVLSVTIGPDGLYSFRCITSYAQIAGNVIRGEPCFRVYFANTGHVIGETIQATGITSAIATGIGTVSLTAALDLSQAGGRPMAPEDYLHLSVLIDQPANVSEGRILLDVDSTTNDFTHNVYYLPFRPADNTAAFSGGLTSLQALQTAAQNLLIGEVEAGIPSPEFINATDPNASTGAPNVIVPDSQQLFSGNSIWTEILIRYTDLQRVGSDAMRSIANVQAIQLWINCTANVNVSLAAWWVGGAYGPDSFGPTSQPALYRYRYRSKLTGAKSQQSPGTRANLQALPSGKITGQSNGAVCYRQNVLVYPFLSSDPQVDQIDVERFGGVLNEWHYVGTVPNTGTPVFSDTYSDDDIKDNPPLETDMVLPFPSFDVPRSGTCDVVGTAVKKTGGDNFDVTWAPGQEILIAGVPYTVYGQPSSSSLLATVENVGVLTGVPFLVAEPTLTGKPLAHLIGPFDDGFLLGWGDPRNPGTVYATKGNNPDAAPIAYYLEVSDPSEPVVGGVIWDNNAVVASNKRFWRISIDRNAIATGQGNALVKTELQVGRGLFSPWAICAGPLIWFLDEACVPCQTDGGPAVSIVEDDLRPLFPHDGEPGQTVEV